MELIILMKQIIVLYICQSIYYTFFYCFCLLLQSITNVMKDASYISRWGLNAVIRQTNTQPLVQMTAHEFMFGYQSTLVTLGNHIMPSWIKFDKLGLIDRVRNKRRLLKCVRYSNSRDYIYKRDICNNIFFLSSLINVTFPQNSHKKF